MRSRDHRRCWRWGRAMAQLPQGDGKAGRDAIYRWEFEARDHFHYSTLGDRSAPSQRLSRPEREPRPLTAPPRRGPPLRNVLMPDRTAWTRVPRAGDVRVYEGVKKINSSAHGARVRDALNWTGVEDKGRKHKREVSHFRTEGRFLLPWSAHSPRVSSTRLWHDECAAPASRSPRRRGRSPVQTMASLARTVASSQRGQHTG